VKQTARRVRYFFWAGPFSGGRGLAKAVAVCADQEGRIGIRLMGGGFGDKTPGDMEQLGRR
jgi:hypothetical protein